MAFSCKTILCTSRNHTGSGKGELPWRYSRSWGEVGAAPQEKRAHRCSEEAHTAPEGTKAGGEAEQGQMGGVRPAWGPAAGGAAGADPGAADLAHAEGSPAGA